MQVAAWLAPRGRVKKVSDPALSRFVVRLCAIPLIGFLCWIVGANVGGPPMFWMGLVVLLYSGFFWLTQKRTK
jgi:hypothetical protein